MDLDSLDRKIIDELTADGRLSVPALADRVGTSRATAYARFDRLVEAGVIRGFHAVIDPSALDLDLAALALVKVDQTDWRTVARKLVTITGVVWVGLSMGGSDFVVLLRAPDLVTLRDSVLDGILAIDGVDGIDTRVLLDEMVPSGSPLPFAVAVG